MLQPMHSRISSSRPSSIFLGRNGSAIDGRAAPIRSKMPPRTCRTISSGEVKRPTPTTGRSVNGFTKLLIASCAPCSLNRADAVSMVQSADFTSHRSGTSASMATTSCASDGSDAPGTPSSSSVLKRTATAQRPPTAFLTSSRISRSRRTRLPRSPPYSSARLFSHGNRNG